MENNEEVKLRFLSSLNIPPISIGLSSVSLDGAITGLG